MSPDRRERTVVRAGAPDTRTGRRGGELLLTVGVLIAVLVALLPLMRVMVPGVWLLGAPVLAVLVLGAGYAARRFRLPALAVSLIEIAVWIVFMTVVFLRDTAWAGFVPTLETLRAVPRIVGTAMNEIAVGVAPMEPRYALIFLIVGATGLLAIVIDHVVVTARMPLLAAVGLIPVSLIPALVVPAAVDVLAFVLLAVAILFLLRAETRSRELLATPPDDDDAEPARTAGVPATAVGIAAIGVVLALVVTPMLPQPLARSGPAGFGIGLGIDATLQLGNDLRRPGESVVLTVRSDAPSPPYLRATTLSTFDGAVWEPDRKRSVTLGPVSGFGPVSVDEDIRVVEYRTTVEILNLSSPWLPVAYPAVGVEGLDGEWAAVPFNRTVISRAGSTQGQTYEVVTNVPRPTREQARAAEAGGPTLRDETTGVPDDLPPIIADLAAEITAGTTNDYDALIALQTWFRSPEFRYSLDAPVEDGFDGTGAEAVAQFLDQREGYCVHYASAFALMARTLGMPSRIVVGYLPGTSTTDVVDGETVHEVSSRQLHAWPEVFFYGIGWIGFEPTNGLGSPTNFTPETQIPGDIPDDASATPEPTDSPSPTASVNPQDADTPESGPVSGPAVIGANPLPTVTVLLGLALLLALPAIWREVRRRSLLTAARDGDSAAAWTTVQEAAIDLGVAVPPGETPRAFAARLVTEHGAPAAAMDTLARAIERASYAPPRVRDYWHGDEVADAAASARAALLAAAPPARRALALAAPRSLVVRPGSAYATARVG